ncbi:MAG: hypothetical protein [Olavius algarvensis Gamma 3 endosymbiont]|nr:MAG: hypothetical protein [Olavius algarvensis Gamma 3 endosymbiont]
MPASAQLGRLPRGDSRLPLPQDYAFGQIRGAVKQFKCSFPIC